MNRDKRTIDIIQGVIERSVPFLATRVYDTLDKHGMFTKAGVFATPAAPPDYDTGKDPGSGPSIDTGNEELVEVEEKGLRELREILRDGGSLTNAMIRDARNVWEAGYRITPVAVDAPQEDDAVRELAQVMWGTDSSALSTKGFTWAAAERAIAAGWSKHAPVEQRPLPTRSDIYKAWHIPNIKVLSEDSAWIAAVDDLIAAGLATDDPPAPEPVDLVAIDRGDVEAMLDAMQYVSEYLQKKWGYDDIRERVNAALTAAEPTPHD